MRYAGLEIKWKAGDLMYNIPRSLLLGLGVFSMLATGCASQSVSDATSTIASSSNNSSGQSRALVHKEDSTLTANNNSKNDRHTAPLSSQVLKQTKILDEIEYLNPLRSVRAFVQTTAGSLQIISVGPEWVGRLGAPSNYGEAADRTFHGNYMVIYIHHGIRQVLTSYQDMMFIQPSFKPAAFTKVTLDEADLYLLAPQYRDGHALEYTAFAIRKSDGSAMALRFVTPQGSHYSAGNTPLIHPGNEHNRLVTRLPQGPGGEHNDQLYDIFTYRLNLQQGTLVLEQNYN